jgi:hypothetical protein
MPVIYDILLRLKIGDVLRRQGLGAGIRVRPEIRTLVKELLADVRKAHFLEPAIAYEISSITELSQRRSSRNGELGVLASLLSSLLPGAKGLAVAVCTIGDKLEKRVTEYTGQREPLRGMLLDGIGSAAVDSLSEEVCRFIAGEAAFRGYEAGSPINPGMPGLPITEQRQLLGLVPAKEIGVSLTSSGIMIPRKSVSMVIGIGPQMAQWTRAEVCARCHLKKTCPHRIPA